MGGGMVQVPYGHTRVSRIAPALGPQAYKTYGISMPLRTHYRPATCEEADCQAYRHGWVTTTDLATDLGQQQADYIRQDRTRRHSEQRVSLTMAKFVFGPGNRCFAAGDHRVPIGRPARFIVSGGDWRGNPRGIPVRIHRNADEWCEDFTEHQDRLATAIRKG